MNRDYKFLAFRGGGRPERRHPARHHLLLLALGAGLTALVIGLTPDNAGATRGRDAALQQAPAGSPNFRTVSGELPLPPQLPSGAAEPAPDSATQPVTAPEAAGQWLSVTVAPGDNMALIFKRNGLSARQLFEVLQLGKPVSHLKHLYPGETIKLRIDRQHRLLELVHQTDPVHSLHVRATGDGFNAQEVARSVEIRQAYATATIEDSLFQAAQDAGLPDNLTMELATIFGWDIDFALDIREGDHFTVVYEQKYLNGERIGDGNIIAAEFTNRGKTYRAVRYTDASGHTDYYSPDGRSMRKAFLRTPVKFTRISSRFSLHRMHPILNRIRAHKGVDYAAPTGTPIRATGDGRVTFRGRKGGYGRVVVIQHGHGYSTLYGHMSAFNRHVHVGTRVRQGQVIGYVGMSGLATGPHLHYEFRIHGVHRNPLTVKLPTAQPLPARYRTGFQRHSTRLIAQLEVLDRSRLARN
ncbi:MAG: peptidoglycan DD-metalloendopeptidase family protein [Gammaproteobacteria bacterium]